MNFRIALLACCLLAGVISCKKKTPSPIPTIAFVALEPDSIRSQSRFDTAHIYFGFADGDGDLGNDLTSGKYDVFLRDNRDSAIAVLQYPFPPIPDDARDPIEGLKGEGVISLLASNVSTRSDTLHRRHGDTIRYQMWIVDRAGHMSNVETIAPLYIKP